jgi:hypothetical protein
VTGGKPIAVLLQSISGVSAINPLVAFYDIHGGKREVLFFYFVPDTTRDDYTFMLLNVTRKSLTLFASSSSSSSAHYSPLLHISNYSPSRSIFSYSHPAPASRPA